MHEKRDARPLDRFSERWPTKGDRIFLPGRDAWPADSIGERVYRLAKGYKLAADALVHNFLGEPRDHDNLIYPILFCYRHYIEITLKQIIDDHGPWLGIRPGNQDHKLPELWKLFLQIAVAYHNDPADIAADAVESCIHELSRFDPGAVAFRYAKDRRTKSLIPLGFGSVDLINMHDVMSGIANFFECATLDFGQKREIASQLAEERDGYCGQS
jgi:hypothetical protein